MKWQVTFMTDEDGFIVVECPALPGCVSQGRTREEALRNIEEAIAGCTAVRRELGLPVPSDMDEVEVAA